MRLRVLAWGIITVLLVGGFTPITHAAPCDPGVATSLCDGSAPAAPATPVATPQPSATPQASPRPSPSASPSAESSVPPPAEGQPDTAPVEWGKAAGDSAKKVNEMIAGAAVRPPFSTEWLPVYALCFGLGVLLMAISLMVTIAKTADGGKVNGFTVLKESGVKAALFIPAFTILPGVVAMLYNTFDMAGEVMMKGAADSFAKAQTEISSTLEGTALLFLIVTSPFLVLLLLVGMVVFGVMLVVELTLAHFALYVMTCLLPLAAGLSIHPKFRGIAVKMVTAMFAVMLVKPVLWLAMWIGWDVVFKESQRADGLAVLTMYVIVLFVSCSVPLLISSVLPRLLGAEALDVGAGHIKSAASGAVRVGERGLAMGRNAKGLAPRKAAADAAAQGGKAAAGAGKAAGAAGPVGVAAAAAVGVAAGAHQSMSRGVAGTGQGNVTGGGPSDATQSPGHEAPAGRGAPAPSGVQARPSGAAPKAGAAASAAGGVAGAGTGAAATVAGARSSAAAPAARGMTGSTGGAGGGASAQSPSTGRGSVGAAAPSRTAGPSSSVGTGSPGSSGQPQAIPAAAIPPAPGSAAAGGGGSPAPGSAAPGAASQPRQADRAGMVPEQPARALSAAGAGVRPPAANPVPARSTPGGQRLDPPTPPAPKANPAPPAARPEPVNPPPVKPAPLGTTDRNEPR